MATMRARIELRGAATHQGGGRSSTRGKPFYSTTPSEIAYFKACGDFSVTILSQGDGNKVKKVKPKKANKKAKAPTPPPEDEDEGEDEDPEPEPEPEDDEEDDEEDDGEATATYTKSSLMSQNKDSLATLAFDDFGLELDAEKLTKAKMVGAIMKAQIEALQSADEA